MTVSVVNGKVQIETAEGTVTTHTYQSEAFKMGQEAASAYLWLSIAEETYGRYHRDKIHQHYAEELAQWLRVKFRKNRIGQPYKAFSIKGLFQCSSPLEVKQALQQGAKTIILTHEDSWVDITPGMGVRSVYGKDLPKWGRVLLEDKSLPHRDKIFWAPRSSGWPTYSCKAGVLTIKGLDPSKRWFAEYRDYYLGSTILAFKRGGELVSYNRFTPKGESF